MGKRKQEAAQEPLFRETVADGGALDEIVAVAAQLAAKISALPLDERVDALNRARMTLHEASPFREQPVDLVLWVKNETVDANDYNPNRVAPPEMQLLRHSIEADGYTQPIVTTRVDLDDESAAEPVGQSETVDGFHRGRCGKEVVAIRDRVRGYLPITRINADRAGRGVMGNFAQSAIVNPVADFSEAAARCAGTCRTATGEDRTH